MALTRCLCLALTLAMLGLRPSAGVRTGSPGLGSWWGTKEAQELRQAANKLFRASDFKAAEKLYQRGYQLATRSHDQVGALRMLESIASAQFGNFRYRAALENYLEAHRRALATGDLVDAGAIDFNLSSLYLQVWDFDSAMRAAERSRSEAARLSQPYFEAPLLINLGRLHEILQDGQTEDFYLQGIEAARRQGDVALEAKAWDYFGAGRLAAHDLATAERALIESFRLRSMFDRSELPFSWALLGQLKLEQRDFDRAALFTDRALASAAVVDASYPRYLLMHQRGEIRLARGQKDAALSDFRAAVDLASRWRLEVPPSISALTAANIQLEKRVFDSFIEAAAERAVRRRDRRLLEQSLAAVEMNRAVSQRESLRLAGSWRAKLPPEYWETQAQLRAESERLLRAGLERSPVSDQLSLRLSELEAETKLRISTNKAEKIRAQISLIDFRNGLSQAEVSLVFHLGVRASYLWAVTREDVTLHLLPPAGVLRPEIEQFRQAVRFGGDHRTLGAALYRQLFGALKTGAESKKEWLLSVDDALFNLPFAALTTGSGKDGSGEDEKFLVEKHSLKVIPGALPLSGALGAPDARGWFLGVGDPIYNLADKRLRTTGFAGWRAQAAVTSDSLNRLVASGAEVESSARAWNRPGDIVLEGASARRARFLDLAGRNPAIIHLATHVLIPPAGPDQALIAFGLGSFGNPEFLTVSDVSTMHVPGALVVMSGCETGAGDVRAGAGLLGLTRAWQTAGASAVVATAWPVADSSGAIFSGFYRNLHDAPPAEALRRSQVDMLRSGSWRAAAAYWAAYQVSGGALSGGAQ